MHLCLNISKSKKFVLEFTDEKLQKFSLCKFFYKNNECTIDIYEDYAYIFIESILGSINKKMTLIQSDLFGKLGQWQEYYYYDSNYIKEHLDQIEEMKEATFVSSESYGIFLYEFDKKIWIEFNRGYDEHYNIRPIEYYKTPVTYRIFLAEISQEVLNKWKQKLEEIKNCYM